MRKNGRCLGLIAGLGPAATIHYYSELVRMHEARGCTLQLLMIQADMLRAIEHVRTGQARELAEYFSSLIQSLKAGGAEIAAIPAVTPHFCAPELEPISPLPLVNILTATAEEAKARGLRRVAIFGTRYSVESEFFGQLGGIQVVRPEAAEIDLIHNTYFALATEGRGTSAQQRELTGLAHRLIDREHLDAILLAGTDLSVIFNEQNTDFPHLDCARAHLDRIVNQLLEG